jgi:hypothetical protein
LKEFEQMTMSLVLIAGCILGALVVLTALIIGIVVILNSGSNDAVSTARQGWINRRSDKDQEGW